MAELKRPVFFMDNYLSAEQQRIDSMIAADKHFTEHEIEDAERRMLDKYGDLIK